MKDTYAVFVGCTNCGKSFTMNINKGTLVSQEKCKNCENETLQRIDQDF